MLTIESLNFLVKSKQRNTRLDSTVVFYVTVIFEELGSACIVVIPCGFSTGTKVSKNNLLYIASGELHIRNDRHLPGAANRKIKKGFPSVCNVIMFI